VHPHELNFRTGARRTWSLDFSFQRFWMIEDLHGICAGIAGGGNERIEHSRLLVARRLTVLRCHLLKHFMPRWITDLAMHDSLRWTPITHKIPEEALASRKIVPCCSRGLF